MRNVRFQWSSRNALKLWKRTVRNWYYFAVPKPDTILALEYEGIYRKTGGSGQSKAITQLFETGDYDSFDLLDNDRFHDISSVTSVLKNYFRTLPIPLLTYDLHDQFMTAVHIRDPALRDSSLLELVNRLPSEHYFTLRMLMLHLNRWVPLRLNWLHLSIISTSVRGHCEVNLMNARNLGVVFGRECPQRFSKDLLLNLNGCSDLDEISRPQRRI